MQQLAIPARVRAVLYSVFGVLGVGVGATQVAYSAAHLGQPSWLTVTISVVVFLGGAFGYTAATHVDTAPVVTADTRPVLAVAAPVAPMPVDVAAPVDAPQIQTLADIPVDIPISVNAPKLPPTAPPAA